MRSRSVNDTHKISRDGEISLYIGFDALLLFKLMSSSAKDCNYLSLAPCKIAKEYLLAMLANSSAFSAIKFANASGMGCAMAAWLSVVFFYAFQ